MSIKSDEANSKGLYVVGGVAALLAAVVFRRNLGAEISLFGVPQHPVAVLEWFTLLQSNPLLGLTYLNLFDVVDYLLVALMYLALWAALERANRSAVSVALTLGLVGIALYAASNAALSMLALSGQYAAATTEMQRTLLLAAGQAMLALSDPLIVSPSTGTYLSLLLVALSGLIFSSVMLQSDVFSKATAYVGIAASALDLTFCVTIAFLPGLKVVLLATAGLFWFLWHILIAYRLIQLGFRHVDV